jgi:hypothetical protein
MALFSFSRLFLCFHLTPIFSYFVLCSSYIFFHPSANTTARSTYYCVCAPPHIGGFSASLFTIKCNLHSTELAVRVIRYSQITSGRTTHTDRSCSRTVINKRINLQASSGIDTVLTCYRNCSDEQDFVFTTRVSLFCRSSHWLRLSRIRRNMTHG